MLLSLKYLIRFLYVSGVMQFILMTLFYQTFSGILFIFGYVSYSVDHFSIVDCTMYESRWRFVVPCWTWVSFC
jgi:hypothetical protein